MLNDRVIVGGLKRASSAIFGSHRRDTAKLQVDSQQGRESSSVTLRREIAHFDPVKTLQKEGDIVPRKSNTALHLRPIREHEPIHSSGRSKLSLRNHKKVEPAPSSPPIGSAKTRWNMAIEAAKKTEQSSAADGQKKKKQVLWSTNAELQEAPFGMMHPSNTVVRFWRTTILLSLIWVAYFLPADLCFNISSGDAWKGVEKALDIMFWMDLVSNFFIGYRKFDEKLQSYQLEFGRKEVALHYMRGWLLIDLIACLSSLTDSISYFAKLTRVPRLLRVMKMVRLLRLLKVARLTEELRSFTKMTKGNSNLMQLVRIFGMLLTVAHWAGCIWYLLPSFLWRFPTPEANFREEDCIAADWSWVEKYGACDASDERLYLMSVYWAFRCVGPVVCAGSVQRSNTLVLVRECTARQRTCHYWVECRVCRVD